MSQMVAVSTVSTGREVLSRAAYLRRSFFPPVPRPRYRPPRPEPVIVYASPVEIDRPIFPRLVYDAPLIISAPHSIDLDNEAASIAKLLGRRIRVLDIIEATSDHFRISKRDLLSHRRPKKIVRPRQVVMYLAKDLTDRSLPEIGRLIGGKDHTTVLFGVKKIARLLAEGHPISSDVDAIRARLLA